MKKLVHLYVHKLFFLLRRVVWFDLLLLYFRSGKPGTFVYYESIMPLPFLVLLQFYMTYNLGTMLTSSRRILRDKLSLHYFFFKKFFIVRMVVLSNFIWWNSLIVLFLNIDYNPYTFLLFLKIWWMLVHLFRKRVFTSYCILFVQIIVDLFAIQ